MFWVSSSNNLWPFYCIIVLWGRSGAFCDVLCFGCGALFSQCGVIFHQRHYHAYQVLSKMVSKFFYFIFWPFHPPPNSWGLDFDVRFIERLPFGHSPTTFVHVHPSCSLVGSAIYFSPSIWSLSIWPVWCGGLAHVYVVPLMIFCFSPMWGISWA